MSRRNEDFDEFCDPDHPRLINYDEVIETALRLRPSLIYTPCVPSKHQQQFTMKLYYKLENLQKSGSFKERGSLNVLQLLPQEKKKIGVVIASLGNDAAGFCYHASRLSVPVVVVMPVTAPLAKIQKCHGLGAKVIIQGTTLMESQKYARAIARDKGLTYINGRDHPHVLAGYGTLAVEILEQAPFVDAIIVPAGSGGLAAAVCRIIKHAKPKCLIYGVQPNSNPGYFKSLEIREAVVTPLQATMADAIAVPNIGSNSFANAYPLLDKMLLVHEDWIARAILHLFEKERLVVEGAAACTLAAIIGSLVPELKLQNVVCILTGGNTDAILYPRCLERGLSAEGRLVKFSVGINRKTGDETSGGITQLLSLLASGGYNLASQFQDHVWVENDTYTCEMRLVCETKGLEHALELKRMLERAYPCTTVFETEPFNDRRACPCYVNKAINMEKWK